MRLFSKCGLGLVCAVAIVATATPDSLQAASPSAEFKKAFSRLDRQLCRSLSLANCKRQQAQKRSKRKTQKITIAKPPQQKPQVAPQADANVPKPTLKPASVIQKAAIPPIPKPVEKRAKPQKLPEVQVVILPAPVLPPLQTRPAEVHGMPDATPTGQACIDSLEKRGAKFIRLKTSVGTGLCFVTDAVQLQSVMIGADSVKLPDQPTLNCGFAVKFTDWIRDEASKIVKTATQSTIASLGTGPGFQCRGRNGDASAKMSEHAYGNAVDIERITLANGETIDVKDAMTIGAKFQPTLATLRATSCQYFTTVLGPGANEAHATHFHLDLARRGKKGNHTMCE